MEKDEKITLWSERIHEFQSSGQTYKTWCQEHHVPVSTMNYQMHNRLPCLWSYQSEKKLSRTGCNYQAEIQDSFRWPETPDELQKVTMKEMHWLCDGLSLTPKGAFEERHPKIVV